MPKVSVVDGRQGRPVQVKTIQRGQSAWWRGGACFILLVVALTGCIPSSDAPAGPNRAADLANLEVSAGALSPAFGPDELNYTVSVGSTTDTVTIIPTVADARATVKVNNQSATAGQPFGPIPLVLGTNPPITILVDGPGISKTYTIVVTRAPNADLQALELSAGALAPAFAPADTAYIVETGFSTASTTVRATLADSTSTLRINGSLASSGQTSGPIPLNVGDTDVFIDVTAPDGTAKQYVVTVRRTGTTNLASLSTSAGAIAPAFNPNTLAYTVSAGFTTDQTTINVTTADSTAAVTVNGQGPVQGGGSFGPFLLAPGQQNPFTIVVTSPTVASKTYTVTVTRQPPSTNANLSNLTVSEGSLQPPFDPNVTNYIANVGSNVSSVTVTATKADPNASVTINGTGGSSQTISLNPAGTPTVISIVVLAQDGGTTRNYLVTVNRSGAGNANLSNLTVTPGSLNPGFSSGNTGPYSVDVASNVGSVTVTATKADANATVSINGVTGTSRTITLPAAPSTTQVNVQVIAQDGVTSKTYTITINRAGAGNANLSNLTVTPGTLQPAFNANTLNYTVDVASTVGSVTVTATKADANATVSINGVTATSRTITLPAAPSTTQVNVQVIAQDGVTSKTYVVNVNRMGANNANLSNLTVTPGSLSPGFSSGNIGPYTVDVASNVGSVTVTATKADANATVFINGVSGNSRSITLPAAPSSTQIDVLVIAQDGMTTKTYVMNVNRLGANNANLSNLTVTPGSLSPGFTSGNTGPYSVSVASTDGSVTVTATKADSNATVFINGVAGNSRLITLPAGPSTTEVNVLVIAQDGVTSKTYVVNVNRPAPLSNNANLSNLTVSVGALTPSLFNPATLGYSITVPNATMSTTVTATLQELTAALTINGTSATSGVAFGPVNLPNVSPAVNTITILVRAQDMTTTKTYTITVTRNP